jgi:molecular chaperone GrpE
MANENDPPGVRVVDRRWWARAGGETATGETATEDEGVRKPTYVEELERRVADQAAQLQTVLADRRRSTEEFDTVKARIRREAARDAERGKRAVLTEMLDVLDNLDRAIAAARGAGTDTDALLKGVELVRDQFLGKVSAFGVNRVAALGEPFDATRHEAVSMAPVDDETKDGVVLDVVKEGYAIGDELLRPASVVVGRR